MESHRGTAQPTQPQVLQLLLWVSRKPREDNWWKREQKRSLFATLGQQTQTIQINKERVKWGFSNSVSLSLVSKSHQDLEQPQPQPRPKPQPRGDRILLVIYGTFFKCFPSGKKKYMRISLGKCILRHTRLFRRLFLFFQILFLALARGTDC